MQTKEVSQESEIKQVIRSLCMMNNRFMNFMLDDNKEAAQVFLRVILEDDKIKVRNVRPQSRSSRTSVQQAIIYSLKMLKKPGNTLFSGLFLCLKSPDSDGEI